MDLRRPWRFGCCFVLFIAGIASAHAVTISASDFEPGKPIPARHALSAQNVSPELHLKSVPPDAKSLVLIADDPDAPMGLWTHWLVWNIPSGVKTISEGRIPPAAVEGKNSFQHTRYDGPAPPAGTGIHRYFFRIYALDSVLILPAGSGRAALEEAMKGHVVASGEIFGVYQHGPAL